MSKRPETCFTCTRPGRLILLFWALLAPLQVANAEDFAINAGLSGSWANPAIPGQGLFVDIDPANGVVFLAWFTYGEVAAQAESIVAYPGNRWFIALGAFDESSTEVSMDLIETAGGIFDNPATVTEQTVGNLSLNFLNCSAAEMAFVFDDGAAQGEIELSRLTSSEVCETLIDAN